MSRPRDPDHRWLVVQKLATRPDDQDESDLWDHLRGRRRDEESPALHALELYRSAARACLQGWLLTKATDEEISRRTGCAADVISTYRRVFFDVSVFRHHFDVIGWIRGLGAVVDPQDARFMYWGVMYGPEAVAYLSGLPCEVSPVDVQKMAMVDGHFRSLMGRDAPMDSKIAREAMKHRALALAAAEKLSVLDPGSGKDFAIKLRHRELTSTIEVVSSKEDGEILH